MSYFIRVATPADTTTVVPQYWEQQIVSPTQKNIYYNEGYVGLGIPNPLSRLAVDGGATFGASYYTATAGDGAVLVSGNVGIGTTAPTHKLHVVGTAKIDGDTIITGDTTINGDTIITGDTTINGDLTVTGTTTTINAETIISDQLIINNAGTGSALIVNQTGSEPIVEFKDDGATVFKIVNGGDVGIGTDAPVTKLDVNGNAKVNGYIHIAPNTLTTPLKKGAIEYNEGLYEGNLFATTNSVNRGIITTEKLYVLNDSPLKGNIVGAQQVFPPASIAVNANTTYRFKAQFYMTRTAGTVSHTIATGLTSTAVLGTGFHSVAYTVISTVLNGGATTLDYVATDALTVITAAIAVAEQNVFMFDGIIRIAAAGFLNLVFSYSAAPGGAPTIQRNAYISLTPIGTFDATDIGS